MAELARVRGVLDINITRSGIGQTAYGVAVGTGGGSSENWLLAGQNNKTENGIYTVTTPGGVWTRRDAVNLLLFGDHVVVMNGNAGIGGSIWYYSGVDNPVDGTNDILFTLQAKGEALANGRGLEYSYPFLQLPERPTVEGSRFLSNITIDSMGLVKSIENASGIDGYITGFECRVDLSGLMTVSSGIAWVPGLDNIVTVDSDTLDPLGSGANGLVYLYVNSLEQYVYTTVAPILYPSVTALPMPRQEGASGEWGEDARFIQAVRHNASNIPYPQVHDSQTGFVHYLSDLGTGIFRVVSAGTATTNQSVGLCTTDGTGAGSAKKLIPPGTKFVLLRVNTAANVSVHLGNSLASGSPAAGTGLKRLSGNQTTEMIMPVDDSGLFTWANQAASGNTNIDLLGYWLRR